MSDSPRTSPRAWSAPTTLVFVLRTDVGSGPRDIGRLHTNVGHLLERYADRLAFVTPGEAMRMLDVA